MLILSEDNGIITVWDIEKQADHTRLRVGTAPCQLKQVDKDRFLAFNECLGAIYDCRVKKQLVFWQGYGLKDLSLKQNIAALCLLDGLLLFQLGSQSKPIKTPFLLKKVAFNNDYLYGLGLDNVIAKIDYINLKMLAESDQLQDSARICAQGVIITNNCVIFN